MEKEDANADSPAPAEALSARSKSSRRGFHRKASASRPVVKREINLAKVMRVISDLSIEGNDAPQRKRKLLAEMCKVLGAHLTGATQSVGTELELPPRMLQTLQGLTQGDSEKQIAARLKLSPHTVHVYVKKLYKRFDVSSRGELLARFVRGQ